MQLKPDTTLQGGKFRIIRVLGQGGFGITYLAENILLDRKVAIKEFFPRDYCGRDATSHLTIGTERSRELVGKLRARFLKEAKNIAKLDHPNIIRIFDVFEENDTAYYVMEYIEGQNLNEIVKRRGPLSPDSAERYIEIVGHALDYIHSRNMTHFDVKPANIIIRQSYNLPILIDFGLSKQYDNAGDATSTMMAAVSNGFSPLELYNIGNLQSFSPQTDVYSLAATLYFLLTGVVPPPATELFDSPLVFPNNMPGHVKNIIEKALQPTRRDRHQTINEFLHSLTPQTPLGEKTRLVVETVDVKSENRNNSHSGRSSEASNSSSKKFSSSGNSGRGGNNGHGRGANKQEGNLSLWTPLLVVTGVIIVILLFVFPFGGQDNSEEPVWLDTAEIATEVVEEAVVNAEEDVESMAETEEQIAVDSI